MEVVYDYKNLYRPKYKSIEEVKTTRLARFFKKYSFPITIKESTPINTIDILSDEPYTYVVSCSTKVDIYDPIRNVPQKSLSTFKGDCTCCSLRNDGRTIIVGTDTGVVHLYEMATFNRLRTFKEHTKAIRSCTFTEDKVNILSASDDTTIKLWNIASNTVSSTFKSHKDYVKCLLTTNSNKSIFYSGSYDCTVKLWDIRQTPLKPIQTINCNDPVESILLSADQQTLYVAASTKITSFDIRSSTNINNLNNPLNQFNNHTKTITNLCNFGHSFIASVSIDKNLKIYDVHSHEVVHSVMFSSPLLSVSCSPDCNRLIVGASDGTITIRYKNKGNQSMTSLNDVNSNSNSKKMTNQMRYFTSISQINSPEKPSTPSISNSENLDFIKLTKYEKYIKKFEYKKALDEIMQSKYPKELVNAVLKELYRRGGLRRAVEGRTVEQLLPLIKYCNSTIRIPDYFAMTLKLINEILESTSFYILNESDVVTHMNRLRSTIAREVAFETEAEKLVEVVQILVNKTLFHDGSDSTDAHLSDDSNENINGQ